MSSGLTSAAHSVDPRAAELITQLFAGAPDPYPIYAELQELGDGIHWSEIFQGYLVTRYVDVKKVASDPKLFSSDTFGISAAGWHDPENPEHVRYVEAASRLFMFADPPVHTRIRSTFRHAFTPAAITAWKPIVERVTEQLISKYPRGEEFDIMPGFAADVPVAVIAAILGVPEEMWPRFRSWSYAYASTFDPMIQGAARETAIVTTLELFDYLAGLIKERQAEPREDLISHLVTTDTIDGDVLGDVELLAQLALLLVAGNETTTTLIGTGLTLLFDNPDIFARVQADPARELPQAIEEMLRLDAPLHWTMRLTTAEVELGERTIPQGSMVWVGIAAANLDGRQFENPTEFLLPRPDNKHLSFLHGIHFCVGAPLARLEAHVVFDYILRTFPDIRAGETPPRRRTTNSIIRGWETRPVVL